MGLYMIKPFKIIKTRTEADGSIGVDYEVWKTTVISPQKSRIDSMQAYMTVPPGVDIDDFLFEQLSIAGWF